jgi:Transposase DDE domain
MNEITLIHQTLHQHFGWHGARLRFLALFLIALFRVRTVNLSALSIAMPSGATADSRYKRLQRFLADFEFDYYDWVKGIMNLMNIPQPWTLAIDRTNWKVGKVDHNILMLAVVHHGVAIPLLWWMLDKRGNSNQTERILLIEEFRDLFPTVQIAALTADREFVGTTWFQYLLEDPHLPFRVRIRASELLFDGEQSVNGKRLFEGLKVGERRVLKQKRRLWGHWVQVAALRLLDGELMIIVTQREVETAIEDYGKRWSIETLFGILKSRGFNLEDTHLRDPERLSKLVALLTLAVCWAIRVGDWLTQHKAIPIKNHGRKAKSIFRVGCDYIREVMFNLNRPTSQLWQAIQFLSCT